MKKILLLVGAAVPLSAALAQAVPPPPAPPQPPSWRLLAWMPGDVRCGGAPVPATSVRRPWTAIGWGNAKPPGAPLVYRFRIDADGRALSIRRASGGYPPGAEDVAPSVAVSRFPAGEPRTDCTIAYSLRAIAPQDAPVEDLISYSLTPLSGKLPPEGWARIRPATSPCLVEPRPHPLTMVFPDYEKLPGQPGVKDWSMVEYDLDGRGRPVHVRTGASTGNTTLNAAAAKAMRASRYTGGARTGCFYPYARAAATLAAPPPSAAEDALRPSGSTCPQSGDWAAPPRLRYPKPYQRRSIEGWATVAFDVAPWGELGNLRVLASEPTAEFGDAALQVLRSARKPASSAGRAGCVERVAFKMGYGGIPAEDGPS
jgi:TonB family protein